jgi:exopolyphosphatase/guanosine-5'-triphosphate,3'-diphosphate pyrophosphatase
MTHPPRQHHRAAVLDIGSNSIKLMLAHQEGTRLTIHHETATTTRLAHKLALTGKICPASRQATLKTLRDNKKAADQFGAQTLIAIGTSALRTATNRDEILRPARKILGTPIRIISGKQEGQLIYTGATTLHRWQQKNIRIIDIGGGSIEFIQGANGRPTHIKSLPLGCIHIRDTLLHNKQPIPTHTLETAITELTQKMHTALKNLTTPETTTLGSGGTCTTIASLRHTVTRLHQLEGAATHLTELKTLLHHLASCDLQQLRTHPRIPRNRADIITAGACILYAAMQTLHTKTIHCTTRGLRYGIWQKMIATTPFKTIRHQ